MVADTKLRIPDYSVQEQIARGGFGLVWRAVHLATRQSVAIKVLHADLVGSRDIILRFQREAETIAQLHHPNVVELYECGMLEDGRPYLVMEHLTGPDLGAYLEDHGPMSTAMATQVLEALTSALAAAHDQGIVHRDLKASNVILSQRDGALRVVLLDFGIAKLVEQSGEPITEVRQAVGSAVCIAPEQIRGEEVDPRTDVYGLGSLAFHMLTGSPPFDGDWISSMDAHLFADRPRPSDRLDIATTFDDVVVRAMSVDRARRHASVREFYTAWCAAARESASGSWRERSRTASQWVVGCYVDVHADMSVFNEPEPALLDDMAAVFPMASSYLEERGFMLAYESGDSALFVLPCDEHDQERRALAINHALELLPRLYQRARRHPLVHVNLFLHADQAEFGHSGVCGGPILDTTEWVVPHDAHAVLVSVVVAENLQLGEYARPVTERIISIYELPATR